MGNDASARGPKASVVTAFCLLLCLALDAPYSPAAAADQVKIGIARTISDAGYYIADAMGFFHEDGLDVSITAFNSAAQMIAPSAPANSMSAAARCRQASTTRSDAASA
jgi:ABC-type nitrate/sulfonate/bicarbonate transport system substrate-binding protein